MKICTKAGDDGTTSLMDLKRVKKSEPVFDVLGTIDELSSYIGLVRAKDEEKMFSSLLKEVQKTLLRLMAYIASKEDKKYKITESDIAFIEENITFYEKQTGTVFSLVIPGGCVLSAELDVARCIARRAERAAVKLAETHPTEENVIIYLNRISDLLYVLARYADKASGAER